MKAIRSDDITDATLAYGLRVLARELDPEDAYLLRAAAARLEEFALQALEAHRLVDSSARQDATASRTVPLRRRRSA